MNRKAQEEIRPSNTNFTSLFLLFDITSPCPNVQSILHHGIEHTDNAFFTVYFLRETTCSETYCGQDRYRQVTVRKVRPGSSGGSVAALPFRGAGAQGLPRPRRRHCTATALLPQKSHKYHPLIH